MSRLRLTLCATAALLAARPAIAGPAGTLAPFSTTQDTTTRDGRWRADLEFLALQLRAIHPQPFAVASEASFNAAVADLDRRIPSLDDAAVVFEMQRLLARLDDGHTSFLQMPPWPGITRVLPLRMYPFADGLYVTSTAPAYSEALGGRVVRIGTVESGQALERVLGVCSGDNEFSRLDRAPVQLTNPVLLRALGISPTEESCEFVVETDKAKQRTFRVAAVPAAEFDMHAMRGFDTIPFEGAVRVLDKASGATPLYLRDRDKPYWFEWVPDSKLLWFQFNSVQHADDEPFGEFCRRMFDFIDAHAVDKMVIDLRFNHGGNNQILKPLIHGLVKRDHTVNRRGHLFTITGRGTFSAAMNCAAWLEEHTNTLYVGEPTGATPNHYGDATRIELPSSRLPLYISHWAWQNTLPWDQRKYIAPHLPAQITFAEYAANHDPAFAAVLRHGEDPDLAARLRPLFLAGNREGARAAYDTYRKEHPDRWGRTTEAETNTLGYALLQEGNADDALAVLRWNAESYPKSANTYDSVAEVFLTRGDTDAAIAWYKKALDVDPEFRNAAAALERIAARSAGHGH